eukprot:GFUD01038856.1.p1 GENE.GFUD01038856.1~~GFUD01038856.1.p1  ORF type:complete len:142 (-),score=23.05 GFUD01038856.1:261-686(-)
MIQQLSTLLLLCTLLLLPQPTTPVCQCSNPYEGSLQSQIGDPITNCRSTGVCFVPCVSTCMDVFPATGFGGAGKCKSGIACNLKGGTTTLKPIIVDLMGQGVEQDCTGSLCKQTNLITIIEKNIQNCGYSSCVQEAGNGKK